VGGARAVSGAPRVLVVGDVVDDVIVIPRGPVRPDTDTDARIERRPGGSGAGIAAWLGAAGTAVDFVGCVHAADVERHTALLTAHGVRAVLQATEEAPTSTIVILVDGDDRTMLTERGANALIRPPGPELVAEAAAVMVSGYSVLGGFGAAGARELIGAAAAAGVPVAVSPGSSGYLAEFGAEAFLDAVAGARILYPNLAEGRALTGLDEPEEVAAALAERFPAVVLTLGAAGVLAVEDGRSRRVPAQRVTRVDPTGAGDAFLAGHLAAWVAGASALEALESGVSLAARAVQQVGGRPA